MPSARKAGSGCQVAAENNDAPSSASSRSEQISPVTRPISLAIRSKSTFSSDSASAKARERSASSVTRTRGSMAGVYSSLRGVNTIG